METQKDRIKRVLDQLKQLDVVDVKLFNLFSRHQITLEKPASTPFSGSVTMLVCELDRLFNAAPTQMNIDKNEGLTITV